MSGISFLIFLAKNNKLALSNILGCMQQHNRNHEKYKMETAIKNNNSNNDNNSNNNNKKKSYPLHIQ